MLYRKIIVVIFFFAKLHSYEGCSTNKNKVILPCKEYDLEKPYILKLADALTEISGISFYAKDTSVFAISNRNGYLFKIHLHKNYRITSWKFDKARDFEEVMLHDSTFYVLQSNGNIESINFSPRGDTIYNRKSQLPGAKKDANEFESMYYNEQLKKVVLICKDCQSDKKDFVSSLVFNPDDDTYNSSDFTINAKEIAHAIGEKKLKFKPSAAAINPLTKDVWILASANQLLVVTDNFGKIKKVYTLNPLIFKQPEGITFTPWGDLLISNEANDKYGTANLLIFKLKRKV